MKSIFRGPFYLQNAKAYPVVTSQCSFIKSNLKETKGKKKVVLFPKVIFFFSFIASMPYKNEARYRFLIKYDLIFGLTFAVDLTI